MLLKWPLIARFQTNILSPRFKYLKDVGTELLQKVESERTIDRSTMTCTPSLSLSSYLHKSKGCTSQREIKFSEEGKFVACSISPSCFVWAVWDELFSSLGMQCEDQLLLQSTNLKLFEMMLSHYFSETSKSVSKVTDNSEVILTNHELNVLRYVGGLLCWNAMNDTEINMKCFLSA